MQQDNQEIEKDEQKEENLKNEKAKENKVSAKEIKKGIAIGFSIFFGTILLIFVSLIIAGFQFYYVITDSMSPTIYRGEMVMVNTHIDKYNLQVGDIVTFEKGATTITHRIVEVCYDTNGNVYYMQAPDIEYRQMLGEDIGGSQMNAKSALYVNEIVGRVVTIGGKPIKLYILASFVGLFKGAGILNFVKVALGVTIIILIAWTLVVWLKDKNKNNKTNDK